MPSGEFIDVVGDGNRKDIRNAVEAANKAAPGWGKRAAHNRAQIAFYIAENLAVHAPPFRSLHTHCHDHEHDQDSYPQVRATEFARRISAMTGKAEEQMTTTGDNLYF